MLKGEFRSANRGHKVWPRRETAASAFALDTDAGGIKPELTGIRMQPDKHRVDVLQRRRVQRFRREAIIHGSVSRQNALPTWISPVAMSGKSGVGTELSNASISARRHVKGFGAQRHLATARAHRAIRGRQ